MKDFANVKGNKSKKTKRKTVFTSKKPMDIKASTLTKLEKN